jgi:orotate phosphoribosyltransferase
MKTVIPRKNSLESPLDLLMRCGGYYECPKDANGQRSGPLVGYANRYDGIHQNVGDVYVNFAKMERHGPVLHYVAHELLRRIIPERVTGFCGAPEGGKALASALALASGTQYIFPDKRVAAVKTATSREISELAFDRHEPQSGEVWWIVEDVCHNFGTTSAMVSEIERFGAAVEGVLCFLNRSMTVDEEYLVRPGLALPVVALVRKAIPEYRQDDPAVLADITANNVVWKPKLEWGRLAFAVRHARYAEGRIR